MGAVWSPGTVGAVWSPGTVGAVWSPGTVGTRIVGTVGVLSLGRTAQDSHLDSHTAPEL